MMSLSLDTIRGCIFGSSYGDAYGHPFEFLTHEEVKSRDKGKRDVYKITDDTQMSIYLAKGYYETVKMVGMNLVNIEKDPLLQATFAKNVADQFVKWYYDKDNNREPGTTCLKSIAKYQESLRTSGLEGSNPLSKGCGANMRAPWLGLLPYADEDLAMMSLLQAKITHGHPDALLSSIMTTLLTKHIAKGRIKPCSEGALLRHSIQLLDTRTFKDEEGHRIDPKNLRKLLIEALLILPEYVYSSPDEDICTFFGKGFTADEALVLAIAATDAQTGSEEATSGIHRLAESSGDSDSIASIGGAMIGACRGYKALKESTGSVPFERRYTEELSWVTKMYHQQSVTLKIPKPANN